MNDDTLRREAEIIANAVLIAAGSGGLLPDQADCGTT